MLCRMQNFRFGTEELLKMVDLIQCIIGVSEGNGSDMNATQRTTMPQRRFFLTL
jgi:hypothetical protein